MQVSTHGSKVMKKNIASQEEEEKEGKSDDAKPTQSTHGKTNQTRKWLFLMGIIVVLIAIILAMYV